MELSRPCRGWQLRASVFLLAVLVVARRATSFTGISPVQTDTRLQHLPRRADPNQWTMLRDASNKQMPRKPPYVAINLLNKVTRMNKEGKKETIRVYSRQSTIIPAMIGLAKYSVDIVQVFAWAKLIAPRNCTKDQGNASPGLKIA